MATSTPTPRRDNLSPTVVMVLEALEMVVKYEQKEDEDPIGIRRVAFTVSFLNKASDDLFLWAQSTEVKTPEAKGNVAEVLRTKPDIPGALVTIRSEFDHNQNKIAGRLIEVAELIKVDPELKDELFAVIPFTFPHLEVEDKDSPEAKVNKLLSDAKAVPLRVDWKNNGDPKTCWKIFHSDGIVTYVPVEHPGVSHLEELWEAGTPLKLSNILKVETRKRKASDASAGDADPTCTPSAMTRTAKLQQDMEKARDDKVRAILPKIQMRQAALKRANRAMSDDVVTFRSYGWAKYEIEYRNRFVPQAQRDQVTQSAWDLLFGTKHLNLDTTGLRNADTFYYRYKQRENGYSHLEERDGRTDP